jgi:hypothetical protein
MRQLSPINATGTLSTRRSSWAADARFRAFDLDSQVPASGRPAPAGDRRPRSALRCGADGQAGNVGYGSHRRRRASAAQWSRPASTGRPQTAAVWRQDLPHSGPPLTESGKRYRDRPNRTMVLCGAERCSNFKFSRWSRWGASHVDRHGPPDRWLPLGNRSAALIT